jgi:glycine betaine/proline transport system ATP-binding protein
MHDGLVAAAERDGKPAVWVPARCRASVGGGAQVFWATPGTPLKTVMLAMHRSQTAPGGLFDDAVALRRRDR